MTPLLRLSAMTVFLGLACGAPESLVGMRSAKAVRDRDERYAAAGFLVPSAT